MEQLVIDTYLHTSGHLGCQQQLELPFPTHNARTRFQ